MATVRYSHVGKTFPDGTRALADFDLDVEDGEFMVLVGPSGCGKSTALRLLAGLEELSHGEVLIDGRVVNDEPPQQRDVAMVFQNYALYPHMSVRRNLEFPLRMMGLKGEAIARRVHEAARLLGLVDLLERRPRQLSGGQRQRVAMGRAIVRDPKVFLMDEPLSNLDARLRVQIRAEIASLQRRMGVTTVYVTHDQVEAMTLGDRVAVLEGGRLQQVDRPQALYDHPANVFVAGFIGSPGMNIFPGVLHRGEAGLAVEVCGQRLAVPSGAAAGREALVHYIDRPVRVGLRPEAFSPALDDEAGGASSWAALQVRVTAVESLGHECIVYFDVPSPGSEPAGGFAARLPDHPGITAGQVLSLKVDLSRLQFFDEAGQAIR